MPVTIVFAHTGQAKYYIRKSVRAATSTTSTTTTATTATRTKTTSRRKRRRYKRKKKKGNIKNRKPEEGGLRLSLYGIGLWCFFSVFVKELMRHERGPTWRAKRLSMATRWGQDGAKMGQDGRSGDKMGRRWGQDGPTWGQHGAKMSPRWSQKGAKRGQEWPR